MQKQLVVTVIGADKPGIVESLADTITRQQGNWLASSMSELAGQFAGILRVGVPAETHEELLDALRGLGKEGIQVMFAESGIEQSCTWKPIAMELVGNDRPGIVRDISRVLTQQGINLERLVTDVRPAPMSNEPLFHAEAILAVPLTHSLEALQKSLEDLADELLVELKLNTDD